MAQWKEMSKLLTEMVADFGKGAVTFEGENAFGLAVDKGLKFKDLGLEDHEVTWDKPVTPKMVRRWLWTLRKEKALETPNVFVWALKGEDTTVGGLGSLVDSDDNTGIAIEVTDGEA